MLDAKSETSAIVNFFAHVFSQVFCLRPTHDEVRNSQMFGAPLGTQCEFVRTTVCWNGDQPMRLVDGGGA